MLNFSPELFVEKVKLATKDVTHTEAEMFYSPVIYRKPELMWRCLTAPADTSTTCNHSKITPVSDNLPHLNFTYLLLSLRIWEQTMAEAVSSNGRVAWRWGWISIP